MESGGVVITWSILGEEISPFLNAFPNFGVRKIYLYGGLGTEHQMARTRDRIRRVVGAERAATLRRITRRASQSYIIIIVIGIIVGLLIAPPVSDIVTEPVSGTVAVVPLEGSIGGSNAASVVERLNEARTDSSVDAVVVSINSGGGGAAASEEIYLAMANTAEEKPVVVSVNGGALSGAYYAAVAADEIYVKPASLVGSIGVIFIAPTPLGPIDQVITTGPNKLTGADQREWFYKTESIQRAFVGAVAEQRSEDLELSEAELGYAKIYTGGEAVDNGLADHIGGTDAAIQRAASLAGLQRYDVKLSGYSGTVTFITRVSYAASPVEQKEMMSPAEFLDPPDRETAPNVVMLPPFAVRVGIEDSNMTAVVPNPAPNDESIEVTGNASA